MSHQSRPTTPIFHPMSMEKFHSGPRNFQRQFPSQSRLFLHFEEIWQNPIKYSQSTRWTKNVGNVIIGRGAHVGPFSYIMSSETDKIHDKIAEISKDIEVLEKKIKHDKKALANSENLLEIYKKKIEKLQYKLQQNKRNPLISKGDGHRPVLNSQTRIGNPSGHFMRQRG